MRTLKNSKNYILIFDTSTLIVLEELDRVDLIYKLNEFNNISIIIPAGVKKEFLEVGRDFNVPNDDIDIDLDETNFPLDIPESLGEGEKHAMIIAYALNQKLDNNSVVVVITDDKRCRRKCEEIGINVFGTLGLIEFVKLIGVISKSEALELVNMIPSTSLYITSDLLNKIKKEIEEQ